MRPVQGRDEAPARPDARSYRVTEIATGEVHVLSRTRMQQVLGIEAGYHWVLEADSCFDNGAWQVVKEEGATCSTTTVPRRMGGKAGSA